MKILFWIVFTLHLQYNTSFNKNKQSTLIDIQAKFNFWSELLTITSHNFKMPLQLMSDSCGFLNKTPNNIANRNIFSGSKCFILNWWWQATECNSNNKHKLLSYKSIYLSTNCSQLSFRIKSPLYTARHCNKRFYCSWNCVCFRSTSFDTRISMNQCPYVHKMTWIIISPANNSFRTEYHIENYTKNHFELNEK